MESNSTRSGSTGFQETAGLKVGSAGPAFAVAAPRLLLAQQGAKFTWPCKWASVHCPASHNPAGLSRVNREISGALIDPRCPAATAFAAPCAASMLHGQRLLQLQRVVQGLQGLLQLQPQEQH